MPSSSDISPEKKCRFGVKDDLLNTACKVSFLADMVAALNEKELFITDEGLNGLLQFLHHITDDLKSAADNL